MHRLHLLLVNSEPCKALQDILNQRDNFLHSLTGMDLEAQCALFKHILIDKKLFVPLHSRLPVVYVFSDDVKAIIAINHPTRKVFDFMLNKLLSALLVQCCDYEYYKREEIVFVFTYDKHKLPIAVKNKLYRDRELENVILLMHPSDF